MANDQANRGARGGSSLLLAGVAILMIAGLFAWLAMKSRESAAATTVAEGDTAAAPAGVSAPAEVVSDTVFEQGMKDYRGRDVTLTARYSAGLSPQTFWIELPTGQPFLIKLDSTLVAQGVTPPTTGPVQITGTVREKDAATVGQWLQQGVLENDDQRMQAEFGTTYIEARQVRLAQ